MVHYIKPGEPNQKPLFDHFSCICRKEVPDKNRFARIECVRETAHLQIIDDNEIRIY